ncbi:MAG: GNAT family N-acetyltransferase [Bacteroidia bacterium]|nr:GNAT family N-acetyltransferase [Bacteroidia bacterium]
MAIRLLDIQKDGAEYVKLSTKLNASVFNSLSWIGMFKAIKIYGIFNDNNELTGSFYLYAFKKMGAQMHITPPFTPNNGLFFENRAENSANINSFNKNVISEIAEFVNTLTSKLTVFILPTGNIETQPFTWKNMDVIVKYTYQIDLNTPEDILLANLSSEKRKSLNKAKSDELEIVRETNMKVVKEVILKTFSRNQISKNMDVFDKILFEFANTHNAFAFVAYRDKKPIAATFCVYDSQRAYYLFGGYDAEIKHHGAGVTCMWQSILLAKQMGLKIFDFEGSMIPEVEKYFRGFGGTLVPYYAAYKASLPLKLLFKLRKKL